MLFNKGKFKLLILSDIHSPSVMPEQTKEFIKRALSKTKPDLIVLLGDNTSGNFPGANSYTTEKSIDEIVSLFDGIPFTVVFGNHDHEGLCNKQNGISEKEAKRKLLSFYVKHENCLACEGTADDGVGNYNILLRDSKGEKDIFNLWFVDSGSSAEEGGYAYTKKSQIEWYEKLSDELKEKNGGRILPSLLFQHIIVPEIYDCFTESRLPLKGYTKGQCRYSKRFYKFKEENLISGNIKEGPCPPDVNGGQFESWLRKGDILAAFFGHDHVNDFVAEYKGIRLINVPSPSFYTYGNNRGVRTVTLYEDNLEGFDTQVIYYEDLCPEKIRNPIIRNYGIDRYRYTFLPIFKKTALASFIVGNVALKLLRKK